MTLDPQPLPLTRAAVDSDDEFSQQLLGAIGQALVVTEVKGDIVVWNAAAERLLGWRSPDALGRTLVDLNLDALGDLTQEAMASPHGDASLERELLVRGADAHFVPVLAHVSQMLRGHGELAGAVLAMSDLTHRFEAEQELRAAQDRLELLVQYSADMVLLIDRAGTMRFVGETAAERGGLVGNELLGRNAFEFVHPDDEPRTRSQLAGIVENESASCELVFRFRVTGGHYVWMEGRAVNLLSHPNVGAVLVAVHDVTERVAIQSQLAHQATHDPLTALPNRALFVDRLEHLVEHGRRHGLTVAVLFWDLNDFKSVNDLAGHAIGDWVLIETARRALQVLRTEDTVARLGGDEFVACGEVQDCAQARVLAERLRSQLPIDVTLADGRQLRVTSSIGLACGSGVTGDRLLVEADRAMYGAKRGGGEAVTVRCFTAKEQSRVSDVAPPGSDLL